MPSEANHSMESSELVQLTLKTDENFAKAEEEIERKVSK